MPSVGLALGAVLVSFMLLVGPVAPAAGQSFQVDTIKTSAGDLEITFIGHATLMLKYGGKVIHVDPWTKFTDYSTLPKADLILLTHDHRDHLDLAALQAVRTEKTEVVLSAKCAEKVSGGKVLANGESTTAAGFAIQAVPAYNLVHMREGGTPYHPKGEGNGYVVTFGDKKLYIAGDTENTPEMKALQGIDIAFLPMNLPYTMTPEMVADAARAFQPKILYPYHYGQTDPARLVELLKDTPGVEVRVRRM